MEVAAQKKYGDRLEVVRFSFSENARAVGEAQTEGMIKLLVMRGRPVGVYIVGQSAGAFIAFRSFVISQRIKPSKLSSMIAPYTTITEVNTRVIGDYISNRLFGNVWIKRVSDLCSKGYPDAC